VIAALVTLAGGAAIAQEIPGAPEPRAARAEGLSEELVVRLLKAFRGGQWSKEDPSLYLGQPPSGFDDGGLLPRDAEVQATLVWGTATTVLLETERGWQEVRAELEGALEGSEWTHHELFGLTGFLPHPKDLSLDFCRGEEAYLTISVDEIREDLTHVTFTLVEDGERSPCRRRMELRSETPLPALYAPEGAEVGGGGRSGGMGTEEIRATFTTALTPFELVSHYAAQLERQGWLPHGPADYGAVAFESWTFEDEAGTPWHGLLLVTETSEDAKTRRAELRISKLAPR
jgi:hypothetical protein